MIAQGISWLTAGCAALAALAALLILHFLRTRIPGQVVPSIMLWLEAEALPVRRILLEKLSRLLSLLLPLLAILAALAALTEPVWTSGEKVSRMVIAAEPDCLPEAERLLRQHDPLQTSLILVSGAGVVLHDFGERKQPVVLPEKIFAAEPDSVSALAGRLAGADGMVCWLGASEPPWLPENSLYIRKGLPETESRNAALKTCFRNAPETFIRQWKAVDGVKTVPEKQAELILNCTLSENASSGEIEAEMERCFDLLMRSGLYESGGKQQYLLSGTADAPRSGAWRLTGWLFGLALLAALLELVLWHKHKTV